MVPEMSSVADHGRIGCQLRKLDREEASRPNTKERRTDKRIVFFLKRSI